MENGKPVYFIPLMILILFISPINETYFSTQNSVSGFVYNTIQFSDIIPVNFGEYPLLDSEHDLIDPRNIVQNGTHIIIWDTPSLLDDRVNYYSSNGEFISSVSLDITAFDIATNGSHFFVASISEIEVYDTNAQLVDTYTIPLREIAFSMNIAINGSHIITTSYALFKEINIFEIDGTYIGQLASYNGVGNYVHDVTFNNSQIFVLEEEESETNIVKKYDSRGNLLKTMILPEPIDAISLYVDNNNIYIKSNNIVKKFDSDGNFVSTIGTFGGENDEYTRITDLEGNATHIFIVDSGGNKFLVIKKETQDVMSIGNNEYGILGATDMVSNGTHNFVVDQLNRRIKIFDNQWVYKDYIGHMEYVTDWINPLAIDMNTTHFFVTDDDTGKIFILNKAGDVVDSFGSYGNGDGQFKDPTAISVNDKHIYVMDVWQDHRDVQIFDHSGNFITALKDINPDGSDAPTAIASNNTHLLISETYSGNVISFSADTFTIEGTMDIPHNSDIVDLIITDTAIYGLEAHGGYFHAFTHQGELIAEVPFAKSDDSILGYNGTVIYSVDNIKNMTYVFYPYTEKPTEFVLNYQNDTVVLNWTNPQVPNFIENEFIGIQVFRQWRSATSDPIAQPLTNSYVDKLELSDLIYKDGTTFTYRIVVVFNNGKISSIPIEIDVAFTYSNTSSQLTDTADETSTSSDSTTGDKSDTSTSEMSKSDSINQTTDSETTQFSENKETASDTQPTNFIIVGFCSSFLMLVIIRKKL